MPDQPNLSQAAIAGWGFRLGGGAVQAAQVDREFGLTEGTLQQRTGIASVARATEGDSEITLAQRACEAALSKLRSNGDEQPEIDLLLTTSETSVGHPALAAALHAKLQLPASCATIDIGGACAGLVHSFSVAHAMLTSGVRKAVLVVASEVHSRWFTPERVTWKLGALFGDGACAFLLRPAEHAPRGSFRLGNFVFGCETAFSSAIRVGLSETEALDVDFRGPALADVVLTWMANIVKDIEGRCRTARSAFSGYAIHQPNPRLVEIFARQLGVPIEKIPEVARTAGNLGSATCGVSLCHLLSSLEGVADPGPLLMAAVGPGLLWAGASLEKA